MSENFKRIKKNFILKATIKSAVCGVSAGALVMGVVMIALKLSAVEISALYYALMFVAPALICGAAVFFAIRPTDKRIAAALDNEYGLGEKVQTSLAFSGKEGAILELQREDTENILGSLPKQEFGFKKIWQYIAIGVTALVILLTSIIVPQKTKAAPLPTPTGDAVPFEITDYRRKAITELIDNVKSSALDDDLKKDIASELAAFSADIADAETVGEMKSAVNGCIVKIVALFEYSYPIFSQALRGENNRLAVAIANGAELSKTFTLVEYNAVKKYERDAADLIENAIGGMIRGINAELLENENLLAAIREAEQTIRIAVEKTQLDGDNIYKTLIRFVGSLKAISDDRTQSKDEVTAKLDELIEDFIPDLSFALSDQSYRFAMGIFVQSRLRKIFKLPVPEPVALETLDEGSGGATEDDDNPGGGSGDYVLGSDDVVYDPNTGEYVSIASIIDGYYAALQELIREGKITEEQARLARSYFEKLFKGIEEDE